ncbi:6651_t:CDS:2, partial [Cetraspora pellucida]
TVQQQQHQDATDHLQPINFVNTGIGNDTSRGLTVQLSVFHSKDDKNVLTWLLQVDLLFKARRVEDEERLQYVITGLKDAALQWYLNQVQSHRDKTLFEDWTSFASGIKAAFQPPHHQQLLRCQLRDLKQTSSVQEYAFRFRNLLEQIEEMHEADKVIYFTKGLKSATKAEVNYRAPNTLDDAVKLAASFDTAMYSSLKFDRNKAPRYELFEQRKEGKQSKPIKNYIAQGPTPMKINRAEININSGPTRNKKRKTLISELKENYKKKGLCFKYEKRGHMARDCRGSNANSNEANVVSTSPVTNNKLNREALLKVGGRVQEQNALILIDSGALKDFVSSNFVERTNSVKCKVNSQSSTIELADGTRCKTQESIKNVLVEIQTYKDTRNNVEKNNQIVVRKDKHTHKIKAMESDHIRVNPPTLLTKQQFSQKAKAAAELFAIIMLQELNKLNNNIKCQVPKFLRRLVHQYQDLFSKSLSNELPSERTVDHKISLEE